MCVFEYVSFHDNAYSWTEMLTWRISTTLANTHAQ